MTALELPASVDERIHMLAGVNCRRGNALPFDDLLQIGREAALRALASHDGQPTVSYLAAAADWRMRDANRTERARSHQPLDHRDEQPTPDDRYGEVVDLLRMLPDRQRLAVTLTVLAGCPYRDAARELGVTLVAFKSLRHRGLKKLRRIAA